MLNHSKSRRGNKALPLALQPALSGISAFVLIACLGGCQSPKVAESSDAALEKSQKTEAVVLHEGDSVRVSFPGAPTLNTAAQQIRRDGKITLPLIGEFKAVGLTPTEMEKELLRLYEKDLQSKEVTVTVESSAFPVYVSGAVLRPGRINSDRPITALEAIMDAGVDYTKANLKAVRVIRKENGQTEHHTLNLKDVLKGQGADQFKLKPQDIVYVPERFNWF